MATLHSEMSKYQYPAAPRSDCTDNPGQVPDPYRWLEDPTSPETTAWVDEENKITEAFLNSDKETREYLGQRISTMYDYPKYSSPFCVAGRYYYYHNTGLQPQSILYVRDSLAAEPRVFLDPNTLSADGTASLSIVSFSEDGSHVAYSVSYGGSDWSTLFIRDCHTGQDLGYKLEWLKFSSVAWTHDGRGFFYARYPAPPGADTDEKIHELKAKKVDKHYNHSLYYHSLGTSQAQDLLVHAPANPEWLLGVSVTEDGNYVIITLTEDCAPANRFYWADIRGYAPGQELQINKLVDTFDAEFNLVTNEGSLFYLMTNQHAPNNRLVTIDVAQAVGEEGPKFDDLLAQSEHLLQSACCVNRKYLLVNYLEHVADSLRLYDLRARLLREVPCPPLGSISSLSADKKYPEFFFKFTSFLHPVSGGRRGLRGCSPPAGSASGRLCSTARPLLTLGTIYRFEFSAEGEGPGPIEGSRLEAYQEAKVAGYDPSQFEVERLFYHSRDGTRIPMFFVRPKTFVRDSSAPCQMYGYGGFMISITPFFSVSKILWMQLYGGTLAVPSLRGGNEYGLSWHAAGILDKKQNVFDDFLAAAQFLCTNGYTRPARLAIQGGSNGGLLVAACITQTTGERPDLFGAGIAQVPVTDMLRFHRFTIGAAWVSDFGCADKPEQFDYIIKYSPLHNVAKGRPYPAVLVTTADHDDRVVPLHSYKFVAELQHQLGGEPYQVQPLLIRVDVRAGHGAGKPTQKIIEESRDILHFTALALGVSVATH